MKTLLVGLMRWLSRHFISFLVIVAILVTANFARQEIQDYISVRTALPALKERDEDIATYISMKIRESSDLVLSIKSDSATALKNRRDVIEQKIKQKKSEQRSTSARALSLLKGDRIIVDDLRGDVDIEMLEQELAHLKFLHAAVVDAERRAPSDDELEQRRRKLSATYDDVKANDLEHDAIDGDESYRIYQLPKKYLDKAVLKVRRKSLMERNQAAFEEYEVQRKYIAANFLTLKVTAAFEIKRDQIEKTLQPLRDRIASQEKVLDQNLLTRFSEPVISVIPTAFGILLSIIFLPIAIKAVFYFVIAPLASRRAAICLMPAVSGAIEAEADVASDATVRAKISAVSLLITVDENHELLVHQEYLQSSSLLGMKDTKWLLNWSYPLSSVLSDMFALTRIRATSAESFVLSATKDPFGEIATISIPVGSAVVFQPHCLVGIVQQRRNPIKITRHWRLGTLHAWLTLQLRYLVFHGPARLIVKGCRGVRVEKADNGRSINQAATIGFSANLAYSTTRCETFASYLMGKQELFNDNFAGGPGFYVYEETPHFGKKAGITGRGIEGVTDTVLKVFGI